MDSISSGKPRGLLVDSGNSGGPGTSAGLLVDLGGLGGLLINILNFPHRFGRRDR